MQKTLLATALTVSLAAPAAAAPFGGADDLAYAQDLWRVLENTRLVGEGSVMSTPYAGAHPHGAVLDTIDAPITVRGDTGPVIIKRNYGGKGVSKQTVANDPGAYLKAVTVMFKRPGYDPQNKDWFWVKFDPGGGVMSNPEGQPLAGRVGKGSDQGCIACHKSAPGEDMVFNNDRF